jgi:DNA invertase Pin-like site-specific DNA recombinase
MARSLAERLRAHEQQKARLAEQEAKLKDDERKARTRRLIQAGGLIEKAGLLELEPNARLRREEQLGPAAIARRLGIGRASVYRVLGKQATPVRGNGDFDADQA